MTATPNEDRILETIRRLLDRANHPETPENEREACLKQANLKMTRYAIDQAMLDSTRTSGEKRKPTSKRIKFFSDDSTWAPYFYTVIHDLALTNRCRVAVHPGYREITVVGMQEDVDWVEILWLQVFLDFSAKINPKWDVNDTVAANIYNFKQAGFKWKDIWAKGNWALGSMPDGQDEFIPAKCKYMITGYKKMCAEKGHTPIGTQTFEAYKLTFTNYFQHRVSARLEQMRADSAGEEATTSGSTVALYDVSKLIEEMFFTLFHELHPEAIQRRRDELDLSRKRREEEDAAYLAGLSPAARRDVLAARKAEEREEARLNREDWRRQGNRATFDAAGAAAGDAAGSAVNLTRTGKAASSGERQAIQ